MVAPKTRTGGRTITWGRAWRSCLLQQRGVRHRQRHPPSRAPPGVNSFNSSLLPATAGQNIILAKGCEVLENKAAHNRALFLLWCWCCWWCCFDPSYCFDGLPLARLLGLRWQIIFRPRQGRQHDAACFRRHRRMGPMFPSRRTCLQSLPITYCRSPCLLPDVEAQAPGKFLSWGALRNPPLAVPSTSWFSRQRVVRGVRQGRVGGPAVFAGKGWKSINTTMIFWYDIHSQV